MRDHTETVTITMSDLIDSDVQVSTIDTGSIDTSNLTVTTLNTDAFDELITLDDDLTFDITTVDNTPVEFVDTMPDVAKIEDMCNDYPAFAKAYDQFKTVYALIHQDWEGKQKENEPPF
tara:strand:+ start:1946 stop:2302 length:357 start_codon:yes stop_codon:yes gene_type:complete